MLYTFLNRLSYASIFSVLIPIGCFFLGKRKGKVGKVLLILLLTALASDVGNEIYVRLGFRGYAVYNVFFVAQITFLSLIYTSLFLEKKIVHFGLAAFWVAFISCSLFFQSIKEYQSIVRAFGGIVLIVFTVQYCWFMYRALPVENVFRFLPAWITMGALFYFSFNLFLFAIANYVFKNMSMEAGMIAWGFHNLNNIIKNCFFAAGLYLSDET